MATESESSGHPAPDAVDVLAMYVRARAASAHYGMSCEQPDPMAD